MKTREARGEVKTRYARGKARTREARRGEDKRGEARTR